MATVSLYNYTVQRIKHGLEYVVPTVQWNVLEYEQAARLVDSGGAGGLYIYGMFEFKGSGIAHCTTVPAARLKQTEHFSQFIIKLACDFTRTDGGLSDPQEIRTFIVLGCPRSGTSLLAGVLHHSGVKMGYRFGDGSDANLLGFYENLDFADLNIQILKTMNVAYLAPVPAAEVTNAAQIEMEIAAAIVKNASGDWGWKDPRTVVLWPWYERCLCETLHPHLVITHRGRDELLRSWLRTGYIASRGQGEMLADYFERRLIEIEARTGYPTLHVQFEDWWDDFDGQVARLAEFVGKDVNAGHFDPELRRADIPRYPSDESIWANLEWDRIDLWP